MKNIVFAVTVFFVLSISAYADNYECDMKYHDKLKRIKSYTDVSDEAKNKWIEGLEKAYQLCKEGKKEQAKEIAEELEKDKEFDSVFSTHDGN